MHKTWVVWRKHHTHVWVRLQLGELTQYIGVVYFPPRGSSSINEEEKNVFDVLQKDIEDIPISAEILIVGDFNARIGTRKNETFQEGEEVEVRNWKHFLLGDKDKVIRDRKSCDEKVDTRGRGLWRLCQEVNLWCMNGTTLGDPHGEWTCFTSNGKSVVDYCLVDNKVLERVIDFKVGQKPHFSDHCPILLELRVPQVSPLESQTAGEENSGYERGFQFKRRRRKEFKEAIKNDELKAKIEQLSEGPSEENIENIAEQFIRNLQRGAERVFRKKEKVVNKKKNRPWYDQECKKLRKEVGETAQSKYKSVIRKKRRAWERERNMKLIEKAQKDS